MPIDHQYSLIAKAIKSLDVILEDLRQEILPTAEARFNSTNSFSLVSDAEVRRLDGVCTIKG